MECGGGFEGSIPHMPDCKYEMTENTMAKITINEALIWRKTLTERHAELVTLRNQNSQHEVRYLGANADKTVEKKPVYSVVKLDALISRLSREMRLLDTAIKQANATVQLPTYEQDDAVLGELELEATKV